MHKPMIHILFIGNSYTYYNDFPALLETLLNAGSSEARVSIKAVTDSGATLQRHWLQGKALSVIKEQCWDYVVLQEHSQLGRQTLSGAEVVNHPSFTHAYIRLFDQAIKNSGAKTLINQTWAHQQRPEEQAQLDYAFMSIADELDAKVVPVGTVWQQAASVLDPAITLYEADGHHPSPMGSLVQACVFYRYFLQDNFDEDYTRIKDIPFELAQQHKQSKITLTLGKCGGGFYELLGIASQAIEKIATDSQATILDSPQYTAPDDLPQGQAFTLQELEGEWSGALQYYLDSAQLSLGIQKNDDGWQAAVQIRKADGTVITTRQTLHTLIPDSPTTDLFYLYIEGTHDLFRGSLMGGEIVGVVQGDHGHYPEPNRWGSWRLHRSAS